MVANPTLLFPNGAGQAKPATSERLLAVENVTSNTVRVSGSFVRPMT
jgi:hypothetical protein